jgi:hypothetical protein
MQDTPQLTSVNRACTGKIKDQANILDYLYVNLFPPQLSKIYIVIRKDCTMNPSRT